MTPKYRTLAAAVVAIGLAGGAAVLLPHFAAADAPPMREMRMRHVEGRIAFLKAELKITDAQAPQWNALAEAMRGDSAEIDKLRQDAFAQHDKPSTAIDRLERRQRMMQIGMVHLTKVTTALKPLYAVLSDEQKKTADELLGRHGHHWH